jgi:tRNA pseudouridine32 synthase/23S rRNA pseudouridine746 synthase
MLSEAFAGRDTKKTYLAIVCGGAPEPRDGEIALALRKTSRRGLDIMEVDASGQSALTRYRTFAATAAAALLELEPHTGRMHQLRAHLAAIGRPIAGDGKYGGLFNVAGTETPSLLLHAAALDIPHPAGGRATYQAPPPPAFLNAQRSLGLETVVAQKT